MKEPLYRTILQDRFNALPTAVRDLHDHTDDVTYTGTCNVQRGRNLIVNCLASILSLPQEAADIPVTVQFTRGNDKEYWTRNFNGQIFRSIQWCEKGFLHERLNLTKLVFRIDVDERSLNLVLQSVYVLGIPVMRFSRPQVVARETDVNGVFQFFIQTSLPLFGLLVQYEGNLSVLSNADRSK